MMSSAVWSIIGYWLCAALGLGYWEIAKSGHIACVPCRCAQRHKGDLLVQRAGGDRTLCHHASRALSRYQRYDDQQLYGTYRK